VTLPKVTMSAHGAIAASVVLAEAVPGVGGLSLEPEW
jgi:hypothetical protein